MKILKFEITFEELENTKLPMHVLLHQHGMRFENDKDIKFIISSDPKPLGVVTKEYDKFNRITCFTQVLEEEE